MPDPDRDGLGIPVTSASNQMAAPRPDRQSPQTLIIAMLDNDDSAGSSWCLALGHLWFRTSFLTGEHFLAAQLATAGRPMVPPALRGNGPLKRRTAGVGQWRRTESPANNVTWSDEHW